MKLTRSQAVSFKNVDDGDYVGVIIGFSHVGMHPTKEWGDKPKCMLRWQLFDLDSPHPACVDDEGLPFVVTQNFSATLNGESWLYKCLVAHGIVVPGGACTDSHEWCNKAAKLTIENVPGSRGDRMFSNVTEIHKLDRDVTVKPTLNFEHWEPDDDAQPPMWAKAMVEKSSDLWQRASGGKAPASTSRPSPAQPGPAASQGGYRPPMAPAAGYRPADSDDDDIPFRYPNMNTYNHDDLERFQSWISRSRVPNVAH